jgi:hypothetical protein
MPIIDSDFTVPEGWRLLKVGEKWSWGDWYVKSHFRFVVGGPNTDIKPGDEVTAAYLAYHPVTKITP